MTCRLAAVIGATRPVVRRRYVSLLAVLTVACGDAGVERETTARIDTVGGRVRVANTGEPSWTPATAWRLEEDLRIGAVGGAEASPEEFGRVASITADSRGRIYVLDGLAQEIRVFEPDGEYSHAIGRPGEGPGEFSLAGAMVIGPGDTLIVRDDGAMRFSLFGPAGGFVRSHRRSIVGTHGGVGPVWLDRDGAYLDWAPVGPDGRFGARFHLVPIRYTPTFDRADTFPPLEHVWDMLPGGMPQTYHAGQPTAAVDAQGSIWFAESSRYVIHRRSLDGDTVLTFDLPATAIPLGDPERERLRESLARIPDYRDEVLAALPEMLPILRVIVSDDDGHVLVFPDVSGEPAGSVVDVFRDDGVYLGRMRLPAGVASAADTNLLVHATAEHLLVLTRDELDVPHVVRFSLIKPG